MNRFPLDTDESPSLIIEMMFDLKVRDVMNTHLITAGRETSLSHIQLQMKENGITGVPIVDGRRLVGIVSMDDIMQALGEGYIADPASERMSRNLIVLEDDMPLSFAISYMEKYRYGRFPVLSKERELVGIITSRDIIVHLLLKMNSELERIEEQRRLHPKSSLYSLPTTSIGNTPDADSGGNSPSAESGAREIVDSRGDPGVAMEWQTRKFDFEEAGKASTEIKKFLRNRFPQLSRKLIRRVAVASYELEMNQVVHSEGGSIRFTMSPDRILLTAEDRGPGIQDIEQALTEGYSTATEWIRSLGFGAGMGLPNARRVSDDFNIQSCPEGTIVHAGFRLEDPTPPVGPVHEEEK
ncbi:CBS domain-containing protein [Salinispira pacifica]|uniref:Anti-sigma B factor RsbT n=1 Tax=Salinispira pacifica TaxID=1307761 RepID=V5WDL6_9SPIO|nr:CBS domain-containing protein [Salinispira pacifica]AHC13710.1 Anti-sigma B factor RsbT [Salinispira pacifica]